MTGRRNLHGRIEQVKMSNYEIAEKNGYRNLTAKERFKSIARQASGDLEFLAFIVINDFQLIRDSNKHIGNEEAALKAAQRIESHIWHTARDICLKLRILLKDHNMKPLSRSRI